MNEQENPLLKYFEEHREILNYKSLSCNGWIKAFPLPGIRLFKDLEAGAMEVECKVSTKCQIREWTEFETFIKSRIRRIDEGVLSCTPEVTMADIKKHITSGITNVNCEQDVQCVFEKFVVDPVESMLRICDKQTRLNMKGKLTFNGSDSNARLKPDITFELGTLLLVGEVVPHWRCQLDAELDELMESKNECWFKKWCGNSNKNEKSKLRNALAALERVHTYMTMNKTRFGIITSYQHTRFLKIETGHDGCDSFLISRPIVPTETKNYTLIGALLVTCLETADYFRGSPPALLPESEFTVMDGNKPLGQLQLNSSSPTWYVNNLGEVVGHYISGTYKPARKRCCVPFFKQNQAPETVEVMVNICDTVNNTQTNISNVEKEQKIYKRLKPLQGILIPKMYGYGTIRDIARVLIIESYAQKLTKEQVLKDNKLEAECRRLLQALHRLKICHGDLSINTFVRMGKSNLNDVRMVNFMQAITQADEDDIQFEQAEYSRLVSFPPKTSLVG
ncbi:hypothetical protein TRICI_001294 [Trichomonascus ciferrii]|uniref:Protein kinase domain-containing protein n=1 Tax=Trichomonascus ciferrii TaxID=44093 RepID=A0A642V9Q7_9ASCO|nr:hypothetical protein TRICI_001294 [Trichomonascus ciferrii]